MHAGVDGEHDLGVLAVAHVAADERDAIAAGIADLEPLVASPAAPAIVEVDALERVDAQPQRHVDVMPGFALAGRIGHQLGFELAFVEQGARAGQRPQPPADAVAARAEPGAESVALAGLGATSGVAAVAVSVLRIGVSVVAGLAQISLDDAVAANLDLASLRAAGRAAVVDAGRIAGLAQVGLDDAVAADLDSAGRRAAVEVSIVDVVAFFAQAGLDHAVAADLEDAAGAASVVGLVAAVVAGLAPRGLDFAVAAGIGDAPRLEAGRRLAVTLRHEIAVRIVDRAIRLTVEAVGAVPQRDLEVSGILAGRDHRAVVGAHRPRAGFGDEPVRPTCHVGAVGVAKVEIVGVVIVADLAEAALDPSVAAKLERAVESAAVTGGGIAVVAGFGRAIDRRELDDAIAAGLDETSLAAAIAGRQPRIREPIVAFFARFGVHDAVAADDGAAVGVAVFAAVAGFAQARLHHAVAAAFDLTVGIAAVAGGIVGVVAGLAGPQMAIAAAFRLTGGPAAVAGFDAAVVAGLAQLGLLDPIAADLGDADLVATVAGSVLQARVAVVAHLAEAGLHDAVAAGFGLAERIAAIVGVGIAVVADLAYARLHDAVAAVAPDAGRVECLALVVGIRIQPHRLVAEPVADADGAAADRAAMGHHQGEIALRQRDRLAEVFESARVGAFGHRVDDFARRVDDAPGELVRIRGRGDVHGVSGAGFELAVGIAAVAGPRVAVVAGLAVVGRHTQIAAAIEGAVVGAAGLVFAFFAQAGLDRAVAAAVDVADRGEITEIIGIRLRIRSRRPQRGARGCEHRVAARDPSTAVEDFEGEMAALELDRRFVGRHRARVGAHGCLVHDGAQGVDDAPADRVGHQPRLDQDRVRAAPDPAAVGVAAAVWGEIIAGFAEAAMGDAVAASLDATRRTAAVAEIIVAVVAALAQLGLGHAVAAPPALASVDFDRRRRLGGDGDHRTAGRGEHEGDAGIGVGAGAAALDAVGAYAQWDQLVDDVEGALGPLGHDFTVGVEHPPPQRRAVAAGPDSQAMRLARLESQFSPKPAWMIPSPQRSTRQPPSQPSPSPSPLLPSSQSSPSHACTMSSPQRSN